MFGGQFVFKCNFQACKSKSATCTSKLKHKSKFGTTNNSRCLGFSAVLHLHGGFFQNLFLTRLRQTLEWQWERRMTRGSGRLDSSAKKTQKQRGSKILWSGPKSAGAVTERGGLFAPGRQACCLHPVSLASLAHTTSDLWPGAPEKASTPDTRTALRASDAHAQQHTPKPTPGMFFIFSGEGRRRWWERRWRRGRKRRGEGQENDSKTGGGENLRRLCGGERPRAADALFQAAWRHPEGTFI